jgi:carbamoyltransferase
LKNNVVLGISAFYHDSAAAIIKGGIIIAAAQEERFTRIKGDNSFPHNAINYCLHECGISIDDVGHIVFYENSVDKFERLLVSVHMTVPKSIVSFWAAMPKWLTGNLWMESLIAKELGIKKHKILFCSHHMSHAASAFYPSPFEDAAILTVDGVGEWSTATYGIGKGNMIHLEKELRFPNSLGLLYSAFTFYTGFKINSGEYKLMGLAPYGEPKYAATICKELIHVNPDGTIILNQKYFDYTWGIKTINKRFENLFGHSARKPESPITQHEMDIAASIQNVTNEIILKMALHVKKETGSKNLVLAGGVALNVVAMGKLLKESGFDRIWIQPAAGDAGGALGAALYVWYSVMGKQRIVEPLDSMQGSFLGPEISLNGKKDNELLKELGGEWTLVKETELPGRIAQLIADGNIVGVARDRMEWGPRALGNRSILGDARDLNMQSRMNLKIKFRESFRPFAPMVLIQDMDKFFDSRAESPYMLLTFPVLESRRLPFEKDSEDITKTINQPRSDIPAVTHLDYSARVQTVDRARHPFMYSVINHFKSITACSVIVNTSFNVRGEPIVNTAVDAYRCFMATDMDYVVIGSRLFDKRKQKSRQLDSDEQKKWLGRFDLD